MLRQLPKGVSHRLSQNVWGCRWRRKGLVRGSPPVSLHCYLDRRLDVVFPLYGSWFSLSVSTHNAAPLSVPRWMPPSDDAASWNCPICRRQSRRCLPARRPRVAPQGLWEATATHQGHIHTFTETDSLSHSQVISGSMVRSTIRCFSA